MSKLETFTTAGMNRSESLSFWNDVALSNIGPMHVEAYDRDEFAASMSRVKLRDCDIVSPVSRAAVIDSRGIEMPGQTLNLQIQHSGKCYTRVGDVVHTLEPGDFMLYDLSKPFRLEFHERTQVITIRLPMESVKDRLPTLRDKANIPCRGNKGAGAMLSNFVRQAWVQLEAEEDPGWAESLSEVIWPLVDFAYSQVGPSSDEMCLKEARRNEVFAFIDRNLNDEGLCARSIANHLGMSARYVQIMFAEIGTTPSAFIQARRLQLIASQLSRKGRSASITELAFDAGFNDLGSFCRAFRRKFGVTATQYRNRYRAS